MVEGVGVYIDELFGTNCGLDCPVNTGLPVPWRSCSWPRNQSPQRKYAGYLSTTLKNVKGVGQQEQQSDKRDGEERDEVKGDVEEIRSNAHSAHET